MATGTPAAAMTPRQGDDVILMGMHAARRQQAQQMGGTAAGFQSRDGLQQSRVLGQRAVFDRQIDTGQFLHDDAAGAQIHMADFRIAHLAGGQADRQARGSRKAWGKRASRSFQTGVRAKAMALSLLSAR